MVREKRRQITLVKDFGGVAYDGHVVDSRCWVQNGKRQMLHRVVYSDGDGEELTLAELKPLLHNPGLAILCKSRNYRIRGYLVASNGHKLVKGKMMTKRCGAHMFSIGGYLRVVRTVFEYVCDEGDTADNPAWLGLFGPKGVLVNTTGAANVTATSSTITQDIGITTLLDHIDVNTIASNGVQSAWNGITRKSIHCAQITQRTEHGCVLNVCGHRGQLLNQSNRRYGKLWRVGDYMQTQVERIFDQMRRGDTTLQLRVPERLTFQGHGDCKDSMFPVVCVHLGVLGRWDPNKYEYFDAKPHAPQLLLSTSRLATLAVWSYQTGGAARSKLFYPFRLYANVCCDRGASITADRLMLQSKSDSSVTPSRYIFVHESHVPGVVGGDVVQWYRIKLMIDHWCTVAKIQHLPQPVLRNILYFAETCCVVISIPFRSKCRVHRGASVLWKLDGECILQYSLRKLLKASKHGDFLKEIRATMLRYDEFLCKYELK